MEIYGLDGSLFVSDPNFFGGTLEMIGCDGDISEVAVWDHLFGIVSQKHCDGMMANYRTAGLADMATAIADGRPHRRSIELAVHAVDVMTAVLHSAGSGAFVDLSTTCDRPATLGPDEARALLV
ncbi:MAG: putative dehydrogenase [Paracoccaceae bacterium]|jgi:predicted dehydrogenase